MLTVLSFSQTSATGQLATGFSIDNIDKSADPCVDFTSMRAGIG